MQGERIMGYTCWCHVKLAVESCRCSFLRWNDTSKILPEKEGIYLTRVAGSADRYTTRQKFSKTPFNSHIYFDGIERFNYWENETWEDDVVVYWKKLRRKCKDKE